MGGFQSMAICILHLAILCPLPMGPEFREPRRTINQSEIYGSAAFRNLCKRTRRVAFAPKASVRSWFMPFRSGARFLPECANNWLIRCPTGGLYLKAIGCRSRWERKCFGTRCLELCTKSDPNQNRTVLAAAELSVFKWYPVHGDGTTSAAKIARYDPTRS